MRRSGLRLTQVLGAIVFFLLSSVSAAYGVVNLMDTEQTVFGPTRVGPALPALQFVISAICIIAAIFLARACATCCRKCLKKTDEA